jgi:Protein of unknown function (DUF3370)
MLSTLVSLLIAQTPIPGASPSPASTPSPTSSPTPSSAPSPSPTASPTPQPEVISVPQEVRALPGKLDNVLVFNSNSPEVVQTEGILLSTFPQTGKVTPTAHLNKTFTGKFDIFAHHIAKALSDTDFRTLYLGIIVHNPGTKSVKLNVLQAATYLSQPDARFDPLPPMQENPAGTIFAGPGDRVTNDVLRKLRQQNWPTTLRLKPGESQMLLNAPIPVTNLNPPLPLINGRSTLARLESNGAVHVASLARFAPTDGTGKERAPTLQEWQELLNKGTLSGPRDKTPTPPGQPGKLVYGRVAGVARGSYWKAVLRDPGKTANRLSIPNPGQSFSYMVSSVDRGTLGTGQVQSAPMLARYPDTAYAAHGNYGIQYSLTLPLHNATTTRQVVQLRLQTPLKNDEKGGLKFHNPPGKAVFFRGTVRLQYPDNTGKNTTRFVHLVQQRGQPGEPLVELELEPKKSKTVQVDLVYPPDATPPQVLTVSTKG